MARLGVEDEDIDDSGDEEEDLQDASIQQPAVGQDLADWAGGGSVEQKLLAELRTYTGAAC